MKDENRRFIFKGDLKREFLKLLFIFMFILFIFCLLFFMCLIGFLVLLVKWDCLLNFMLLLLLLFLNIFISKKDFISFLGCLVIWLFGFFLLVFLNKMVRGLMGGGLRLC